MPLPESGPLSASQVATEFGLDQEDLSFVDMGEQVGIDQGDPVTLPDDFYGAAGATPTVQTNAVTNVAATSMTLNGNITSAGASTMTDRGFYLGTNASYASNSKISISGLVAVGAMSHNATGLSSGTTYYVTAYAVNDQGEAVGSTVSQATSGGSVESGSLMRYGTTSQTNIAHRLIMPTTEEPTTSLRMGQGSTFTVNFWVKAGWTSALNSQGRYQFMFGWGGEAITSGLLSNVYNQNFRIFYDESNNRMWIGFLAPDSGGTRRYRQNFWFFHKNSGSPNISNVTGLGTTYWSNTNRGNTNDNDFTMITFTVNGGVNSSQVTFYWNGANVGTPYYGTASNNGTPGNNTGIARGITLLGAPYSQNTSPYAGTFSAKAGYLGGNGNTYIDEVSIWDSALSSTAVADLYNEGLGGTISTSEQPEGLIAYWDFNSTSQNSSPKYALPIWPDPSETSNKGKMYVSGSSDFGSGTNTVSGS